MRRLILGALAALAVSGCTTYEDGTGSYWSSPTTLVVSGDGNEFTSAETITDFVFLQAAEKALDYGYGYFVMRAQADTTETQTTTVYTPPNANYAGGVNTYHTALPGLDAVFEMYEEPPEGFRPGQYWEALSVYHELGPKHLGDDYDASRGIE
jgi:hypothetical protein